jgi:hypothetical protein
MKASLDYTVSLENNNFNRIISKYHTKLNEVALHRTSEQGA